MKISGIGFAIVLLAFLMPFMAVKCANTKLVSLSGLKLATGGKVTLSGMEDLMEAGDFDVEEDEETNEEKLKVNFFALLALLAGIGGLVTALVMGKDKYLIPLVIAGVGIIAMLLIKTGLKGQMDLEDAGEYAGVIKIELQFGFILAFLGFIFAGVMAYLAGTKKGSLAGDSTSTQPGGMGYQERPPYSPPPYKPPVETPPVEVTPPNEQGTIEEVPKKIEEETEDKIN